MKDFFGRELRHLRISVTDRCNLRCSYCMPPEGITLLPRAELLSLEEILEVAEAALDLGLDHVRLTGGEPLLRRDLTLLIERLARLPGLLDLAMTTNATRLQEHADGLKRAGLRRVNISLDTLDEARFREMTRGGDLSQVLAGIDAADAVGLRPIKLNCVVERSREEPDARAVGAFGQARGFEVRYIPRMDLRGGRFSPIEGGSGGNCSRCDRLRLTSNGYIKPCLFSDQAFSVRELGPRQALERASADKPRAGERCLEDPMVRLGG